MSIIAGVVIALSMFIVSFLAVAFLAMWIDYQLWCKRDMTKFSTQTVGNSLVHWIVWITWSIVYIYVITPEIMKRFI